MITMFVCDHCFARFDKPIVITIEKVDFSRAMQRWKQDRDACPECESNEVRMVSVHENKKGNIT